MFPCVSPRSRTQQIRGLWDFSALTGTPVRVKVGQKVGQTVDKLKVLDLFSGIGGFSLGLDRTGGFETVAFCEIEDYPRKVLAKHWPGVPIYDDVRELTTERLISDGIGVDIITGGFPCQDISNAGKGAGINEDTRSGLWSECARLLGEIRPAYTIFENVTALLSGDNGKWFQRVLWDISQVGYDAEWHCIPASELGANHHRDRVWIIAYPTGQGANGYTERESEAYLLSGECGYYAPNAPNPNNTRLQGRKEFGVFGEGGERWHKLTTGCFRSFENIGQVEPTICRTNDGIPNFTHRLKGLGNAVVPQIPEILGRALLESMPEHTNDRSG